MKRANEMIFTFLQEKKRKPERDKGFLLLQLLGLLLGSSGLGSLGSLGVLPVKVVEQTEHGPHVEPEKGGDEEGVSGTSEDLHGIHVPGRLDRHHAELGHLRTGNVKLDERHLLEAQSRQEVVSIHDDVDERVQGSGEVS